MLSFTDQIRVAKCLYGAFTVLFVENKATVVLTTTILYLLIRDS